MAGGDYALDGSEAALELARLHCLEAWLDPFTVEHLERIGVSEGWRCLEVGAGAGSIARWLGARVGQSGSVLAIDLNLRFLTDLPANVAVRALDVTTDLLPSESFDLIHARSLLMHMRDPPAVLARLVSALAPGGWLLVEDSDLGLFSISGCPQAEPATLAMHRAVVALAGARIFDPNFGRRVPGFLIDAGLDAIECDTTTAFGRRGDHGVDSIRLAFPSIRPALSKLGLGADEVAALDAALASEDAFYVGTTQVAAWGRKAELRSPA